MISPLDVWTEDVVIEEGPLSTAIFTDKNPFVLNGLATKVDIQPKQLLTSHVLQLQGPQGMNEGGNQTGRETLM